MKRRGRRKANKWYLICSVIEDHNEDSKEMDRWMSGGQFRELYKSMKDPKPCGVPRPLRGSRWWGYWDYGVFGETGDGKTVYLFSDLPPKRYTGTFDSGV